MAQDMNQNGSHFCLYYHNEEDCPYRENYRGRAWIAEKFASERANASAIEFLSFVAAHISKWYPYGFASSVAKYIGEFSWCSIEEKKELAQEYGLDEELLFEKPKGRTVFEFIDEGGYAYITRGYLLYFDGRVYSVYGGNPKYGCLYVYEGTRTTLIDQVKAFIRENWEAIQKLPKETTFAHCCDGSFQYYKFLSKRSHGYMMEFTEDGKEVLSFADRIEHLIHSNDIHIYDFDEDLTQSD